MPKLAPTKYVGRWLRQTCGYDGGDCNACNGAVGFENIALVGDGVCNGGQFNTEKCNWDGGDCKCINDALKGTCDDEPDVMLRDCRAACQIIPLVVSSVHCNNSIFSCCTAECRP